MPKENAGQYFYLLPQLASETGILPYRSAPIRFAVGSPFGLSSNAWRVWFTKHGDTYISCRDNLKEAKVSLHASGRWRIGFTAEAIAQNPGLLKDDNRAWHLWDSPAMQPGIPIAAFKLFFLRSELVIHPDQRAPKTWSKVTFIDPSSHAKMIVVAVFVSSQDMNISHESEPSFHLASLEVSKNKYVHIVAHADDEGEIPSQLETSIAHSRKNATENGISLPDNAFGYFFGKQDDGSRFIIPTRMNRPTS